MIDENRKAIERDLAANQYDSSITLSAAQLLAKSQAETFAKPKVSPYVSVGLNKKGGTYKTVGGVRYELITYKSKV